MQAETQVALAAAEAPTAEQVVPEHLVREVMAEIQTVLAAQAVAVAVRAELAVALLLELAVMLALEFSIHSTFRVQARSILQVEALAVAHPLTEARELRVELLGRQMHQEIQDLVAVAVAVAEQVTQADTADRA